MENKRNELYILLWIFSFALTLSTYSYILYALNGWKWHRMKWTSETKQKWSSWKVWCAVYCCCCCCCCCNFFLYIFCVFSWWGALILHFCNYNSKWWEPFESEDGKMKISLFSYGNVSENVKFSLFACNFNRITESFCQCKRIYIGFNKHGNVTTVLNIFNVIW